MKKKRKQIMYASCTVLLCTLAVVGAVYLQRSRDSKLLTEVLTETDSNVAVQQTNTEVPKEEQAKINTEEDFQDKFMEQGEEKQIEGPNTYKINNDKCSISFDSGESWDDIPLEMNELCSNEGGYPYKNKLQDGSYVITSKYTAISYGGTNEVPLSIIYSSDSGKTWNTSKVDVDHELKCVRVKIVTFINDKCGYIIATNDKTMSVESKFIYKTNDGGNSWSKVNVDTDITGHLLYNAGFVSENVGFLSMVSHDEPIIYRTDDGGKTFEEVKVEVKDDMSVQPSVPYISDNKLYLEIGTHQSGDYLYDFEKSSVCESKDVGKSFR